MALRTQTREKLSRGAQNVAFFLGFLRHPELVGSVIPSSRFLERRLVEVGELHKVRLVVELGPGTGGTTRAILNALPPDAKMLAIEIDERFAERLRRDADPRLFVYNGSAEDINAALEQFGLPSPDVVFSGIPFSTMPRSLGSSILEAVWSSLAPGGKFVAYQYRDRVAELGRMLFGHPQIQMEALNIPPTRVFHWQKPVAQPA